MWHPVLYTLWGHSHVRKEINTKRRRKKKLVDYFFSVGICFLKDFCTVIIIIFGCLKEEEISTGKERETEQWHSSCIFSLVWILNTYFVCIMHTVNVCNLLCCHQYLLSYSFFSCVVNSETIKYTASNSIARVCVWIEHSVKIYGANKWDISQGIA